MQKIIFFTLIFFFTVITVNAQLANTKWHGVANANQPFDLLMVFQNDTAKAFMLPDSVYLAGMSYIIQDSVISFKKVGGGIPCDSNVVGKYKFEIKDNTLSFFLIEDDCIVRSHQLNEAKYEKVE